MAAVLPRPGIPPTAPLFLGNRTDLVELILDLGAAADLDDGVDDLRARGAVLKLVFGFWFCRFKLRDFDSLCLSLLLPFLLLSLGASPFLPPPGWAGRATDGRRGCGSLGPWRAAREERGECSFFEELKRGESRGEWSKFFFSFFLFLLLLLFSLHEKERKESSPSLSRARAYTQALSLSLSLSLFSIATVAQAAAQAQTAVHRRCHGTNDARGKREELVLSLLFFF